jgi:hypothetical protein
MGVLWDDLGTIRCKESEHKISIHILYSPNVVMQALPMPSGVAPTTRSSEPSVCFADRTMEIEDWNCAIVVKCLQ